MKTFQVGHHRVQVSESNGRWTAAVDDVPLPLWFRNEAEAWAAGVREADRLDRIAA